MGRRIPPLNQLRAFEAAARHGSFRRAGDELNVTHSAISHQVKALEHHLGAPLFRRQTRGVELTDNARKLFDAVRDSLDRLDASCAVFRADHLNGVLKLSVAPSFASRWLLRRLPAFRNAYPGISVEMEISADVLSFSASDIDVAIRHGFGKWRGLSVRKLFDEELYCVASPTVRAQVYSDPRKPSLEGVALLTATVRAHEWETWIERTCLGVPRDAEVINYPTQALAIDGAVSGLGAALSDYRLVAEELEDGRLQKVTEGIVMTGRGFYLVWPKSAVRNARINVFGEWLMTTLEST